MGRDDDDDTRSIRWAAAADTITQKRNVCRAIGNGVRDGQQLAQHKDDSSRCNVVLVVTRVLLLQPLEDGGPKGRRRSKDHSTGPTSGVLQEEIVPNRRERLHPQLLLGAISILL